jgi:hypothetical protein
MKSSKKSSKAKKKEYNYIIHSHGAIFTSIEGDVKKYMAIKIPKNVELFTYTTFGKAVATNCKKNYFICDNLDKVEAKYKNTLFKIEKPTHKYKYKQGTRNIFPEVMLIPDEGPILKFYSGIVHCIPHAYRSSSIKGMEIIHNMDANSTKDCADDSIRKYYKYTEAEDKQKLYDTNTKYSKHYKELIEKQGKKREAPLDTINKCGAILLSEAIKIIQTHCKENYGANNTIKIYLNFCLDEENIEQYDRTKNYFSKTNKEEVIEYIAQNFKTPDVPSLTKEEIDRVYYDYLDRYSLDTESIIINDVHTTDIEEFAKNLDSDHVADIQDSFSYDYVYFNKNFKLIISKTSTHKLDASKYYKYDIVSNSHYIELMEHVIDELIKYVASWHIDYANLPNNITIDVRKFEQPTKDDIFKELIHALTSMVEKLQTTIIYDSENKTWKLVVNLLHDTYLDNKNDEYDAKITRVIKEIFKYIQISHSNILSKIVNFNLKLSVLDESEDDLYEQMKEQIIEQSDLEEAEEEAETAVARQRELINLAREAAAEQEAREAAAEEEAREAVEQEARARAEAEEASREKEEATARAAAEKVAREKEAVRAATEKATREEEEKAEKAKIKLSKSQTKKNMTQRLKSFLSRRPTRIAPEPLQVKTTNMNTNNSQTKKNMTQRLKSFFSRGPTRIAPAPHNVIAGIKTKFRRKHTRRPRKI